MISGRYYVPTGCLSLLVGALSERLQVVDQGMYVGREASGEGHDDEYISDKTQDIGSGCMQHGSQSSNENAKMDIV